MSFRSSASFGKRQEYIAVAELLRRNFDVYMTLVDDQQIDCVIRQEEKDQLRYLDIQIKARSDDCEPKNAGRFAAMEIRAPRENFYFIFYSEQANTYWVIPSMELVKEANQNKEGKNKGKYSINFCNVTKGGVTPRPRFKKYQDAFQILGQAIDLTSNTVSQPEIPIEVSFKKSIDKQIILRDLPDYWYELHNLVGRTLITLKKNQSFRILDVTQKTVTIRIDATGNERLIDIDKEITPAYQALVNRGEITRTEIEDLCSPRNPAYVSAILAAFPCVEHAIDPIRLHYLGT